MSVHVRLLAATLCLSACPNSIAWGQQVLLDVSSEPAGRATYQVKWQPELQRVIAYRDISDPNAAAIRVLNSSGEDVSIYPLRDLPGSTYLDIWDATGEPNGNIVVAAVPAYGPRNVKPVPVKSVILIYTGTGTLMSVWDVNPYHHHRVAADSDGDVFALGDSLTATGDYPLVVKYSASGEVLGEFLSSSLFPGKDAVVAMTSPNGEPQLFVKNGRLHVWVAATLQLITFSLDGVQLSATSLLPGVQDIANLSGNSQVRFLGIDVDSNEQPMGQVRLQPKNKNLAATVALVRLKPDGTFDGWAESASSSDVHRFVGFGLGDKAVFLEKVNQHAVRINLNE